MKVGKILFDLLFQAVADLKACCGNTKFGRCFVCNLIQAALYSCVGILQAEIKYIALVGFKFPHGLSTRHLNAEPKHKPALADFT